MLEPEFLDVIIERFVKEDSVVAPESRESPPIIISREWVTMESCLVSASPAVSSWILVTWSPVLAMWT